MRKMGIGMNKLVRGVSSSGFVIFVFGFVLTFLNPTFLEVVAAEYIQSKATGQVNRMLKAKEAQASVGALGALSEKYRQKIEWLKSKSDKELEEELFPVFSRMRNLDCECRRWLNNVAKTGIGARIASLGSAADVLEQFAMGAYGEVVRKLKRDFRIFTGSSAFAFLLVLMLSVLLPQCQVQLLVPGGLLAISTSIAAWFYLFEQNWFFTILTNAYMGFGYIVWLIVIFGILADIVLNRARITRVVTNIVGNALGAAVPC